MNLVALDSVKLLVLMAAGGLFAATGLWLLLRPKPEGGAKIELFGLKFESSSAWLLVFLIGAAFLATPLFVPERTGPPVAGTAVLSAAAPVDGMGIPQRVRAEGREREPNDDYDNANQISVGDSVSVFFDRVSEDWFVMPVDPVKETLYIKLRSNSGQCFGVYMLAYTEREFMIKDFGSLPQENTVDIKEISLVGSSFVFLRFRGHSECRFEFFTSYVSFQ